MSAKLLPDHTTSLWAKSLVRDPLEWDPNHEGLCNLQRTSQQPSGDIPKHTKPFCLFVHKQPGKALGFWPTFMGIFKKNQLLARASFLTGFKALNLLPEGSSSYQQTCWSFCWTNSGSQVDLLAPHPVRTLLLAENVWHLPVRPSTSLEMLLISPSQHPLYPWKTLSPATLLSLLEGKPKIVSPQWWNCFIPPSPLLATTTENPT